MKRLICAVLVLMLLPVSGALAAKSKAKTEVKLPKELKLTLTAGKYEAYTQSFTGAWESSDPAVANAEMEANSSKKVRIVGYQPGEATLTLQGKKAANKAVVHVTVLPDETAENPVPELIQSVLDIALAEWEEIGEVRLPSNTKNNKYLKWWGAKCGWCGVFTSYCMEKAGVPMDKEGQENKVKPLGNGDPHSIRVGGVGRFHDAFVNMERVTRIPRPGYLVIYGQRGKKGSSAYNYEHIALVSDVEDRGDGVYRICTVEGNWGQTVKRFSYLYDARNVTHENMAPLPQEEQTEPQLFHQYELHSDRFFIYEFCQTWY